MSTLSTATTTINMLSIIGSVLMLSYPSARIPLMILIVLLNVFSIVMHLHDDDLKEVHYER